MVSKLIWQPEKVSEKLNDMLYTLSEEYPVFDSGRGLKLRFQEIQSEGTVSRVSRSRGEALIEYSSIAAAARGVGSALSGLDGEESTPFEQLGIMLDVSRNQVMTVEHLKMWFRRLALAGCNQVMLYCEDTYQLPDEPWFGAYRGGYSLEEIQELDLYSSRLGIELIGCVQTLGHLEHILKWPGPYDKERDTGCELAVDMEETYALIQKIIDFWGEALRSRRIHIGMDETHNLGRGRLMDRKGYIPQFELFNRHLSRVCSMCRKAGLKPDIWSDMYFRLANTQRDYYNLEHPIPQEVKDAIPKDVRLVYWDYYKAHVQEYKDMIAAHRKLGYEPPVASGIWTWGRLWYDHGKTDDTAPKCITACREMKIKELYFTMWGDNGAFCNFDSSLAGIMFIADIAYGVPENDKSKRTAKRFEAVCQSSYDAHLLAAGIEGSFPDKNGRNFEYIAALLLWDDPLLGICYDNYLRVNPQFHMVLLDKFDSIICRLLPFCEGNAAGDFDHAINILQLLSAKLELRTDLELAYQSDDRIALRQIEKVIVPQTIAAAEAFNESFRRQWLRAAKPFGLELIQGRNAMLIERLKETGRRIREYLDGITPNIAELEAKLPPDAPVANLWKPLNVMSGSDARM